MVSLVIDNSGGTLTASNNQNVGRIEYVFSKPDNYIAAIQLQNYVLV